MSDGLQNALWELGGVPQIHQTDRLSSGVQKPSSLEEFTQRYNGLLKHYGLEGRKIQTGKANENGDIEQRHNRFKKAVEQSLMLRGSKNFVDRKEYEEFLKTLFKQLNSGRRARLEEELKILRKLPNGRLDSCKRLQVKVGPSSTIRVNHNVYSVNSRLIGESVKIKLYAEHLELWYAQRCIEKIPRLRGGEKHHIQYRHIIDWLVRKPGAFENFRYREDLFPTHRFRVAYDSLKRNHPCRANKEYLKILYLAARENETSVDAALNELINNEKAITIETVFDRKRLPRKIDVQINVLLNGSFLDRTENVLAFGNPGSGKTHLLCAIGYELVQQGRRILFKSCNLLVQEMLIAKRDLKLQHFLKQLSKYNALIIIENLS